MQQIKEIMLPATSPPKWAALSIYEDVMPFSSITSATNPIFSAGTGSFSFLLNIE